LEPPSRRCLSSILGRTHLSDATNLQADFRAFSVALMAKLGMIVRRPPANASLFSPFPWQANNVSQEHEVCCYSNRKTYDKDRDEGSLARCKERSYAIEGSGQHHVEKDACNSWVHRRS
jgi:hypothetical protein